MSIQEAESHSLDFEIAAEQAAMNKVMDIHNALLLKHSFLRFGVPIYERDFNGEVRIVSPEEDRLKRILKEGLIFENFAKRCGFTINRNWLDPVNKTKVSLANIDATLEQSFWAGIWVAIGSSFNINIPREGICTILVENKPYIKRNPGEKLATNRVNPRFFKGIVILDQKLSNSHRPVRVDLKSTIAEETAGIIVDEMLSINRDRPNRCIPVYGLSGSLYWPRQMSYQEVQKFVSSRNR